MQFIIEKVKNFHLLQTKKQKTIFFIALILLFSFFLKLWKLDSDSLWIDEIKTLDIATGNIKSFENNYEYYFNKHFHPVPAKSCSEVIDYLQKGGDSSHLPFYYCLFSKWLSPFAPDSVSQQTEQSIKKHKIQNTLISDKLNQISETIIRLPSIFFSLIASTLLVCICQLLFRKYFISLICTFIVSTSPYLFYFSQEARVYSLLLLLVNLIMFLYFSMKCDLSADRQIKGKFFSFCLYLLLILFFLTFGVSLHMTFLFLIPTLLIISFIDFYYSMAQDNIKNYSIQRIKNKSYIFLPLIILIALAIYWLFQKIILGNFIDQNFNFKEVSNINYVIKVAFSAIVHFSLANKIPWPLYLSLIPIVFSIFSFYITSAFSKKIKLILTSWLLFPILFNGIAFLISNRSFSNSRYMIVAAPAILLIISAGLYSIGKHSLGKHSLNKSELSQKLGLADSVQNLFSKLKFHELSLTFIVLSYLLTIVWMKYTPQKQNWRLLGEKIEIKVNLHEEPTKVITQKEQATNKEKVIVYPSPTYLLIPLNYYWKSPRHEIKDLKTKLSNPNELPGTILIVMENLNLFDEEKKLLQNNGYIEISHEKFTGIHLKTFKQSN